MSLIFLHAIQNLRSFLARKAKNMLHDKFFADKAKKIANDQFFTEKTKFCSHAKILQKKPKSKNHMDNFFKTLGQPVVKVGRKLVENYIFNTSKSDNI